MNKKSEQMTRYTFRVTKQQAAKLKSIKNASKLLREFVDSLPSNQSGEQK